MPVIDRVEHAKRKKATIVFFHDKSGKPLSPAHTSLAVQDKRDMCDINRIVAKGSANGLMRDRGIKMDIDPILLQKGGVFGDFTKIPEFSELKLRISRVQDAFMRLKPEIRAKFQNDPKLLLQYLDTAQKDRELKKEAIALGLLPRPKLDAKKVETPEGTFWVHTEDGIEVSRNKIEPKPAPAPGA